jgi:hypothetical protein
MILLRKLGIVAVNGAAVGFQGMFFQSATYVLRYEKRLKERKELRYE